MEPVPAGVTAERERRTSRVLRHGIAFGLGTFGGIVAISFVRFAVLGADNWKFSARGQFEIAVLIGAGISLIGAYLFMIGFAAQGALLGWRSDSRAHRAAIAGLLFASGIALLYRSDQLFSGPVGSGFPIVAPPVLATLDVWLPWPFGRHLTGSTK